MGTLTVAPAAQADRRVQGFAESAGQASVHLIFALLPVLALLATLALLLPGLSRVKALGLTAGMVIFVISFASTQTGLYILIFSMLLSPEFVIGSTEGATLGRGVTLRVDDLLILVIGLSWLARMSINKELGFFLRTPLNKPIAYYLLVCFFSTLFGGVFGRVHFTTGMMFVLKYFEYVIIYFMAANLLERKGQIRHYLWAILLTCAIVSIVCMAQIPTGERISAPFEGEVGEPNTLGGYLVFMIALTTGLLLAAPLPRDRILYAGLILLFAVPLLYTQSRSSYLAAIPAMLTFAYFSEKRHWVVMGLILVGLSLTFLAPQAAKDRVSYTFTQGRERADVVEIRGVKLDTSTSARLRNWQEASRDWIKHPFLGFGVTGYRFVDAQYVRVITETGVLGLLSFLFLVFTILQQAHGTLQGSRDPLHRGLCMGYLAGLIGLLFHAIGANTFIIVRIMEPFWFVTAMVMAIPSLEAEGDRATL